MISKKSGAGVGGFRSGLYKGQDPKALRQQEQRVLGRQTRELEIWKKSTIGSLLDDFQLCEGWGISFNSSSLSLACVPEAERSPGRLLALP